jgi:hypothetical protein
MGTLDREVEARLMGKGRKLLDVFTEDFERDHAAEGAGSKSKPNASGGYGKKHEDSLPEADPSFTLDKGQEKLDQIDLIEQQIEARIKGQDDQFPGSKLRDKPTNPDVSAPFDVHQTDPARLKAEVQKDLDAVQKHSYKGREIHVHPHKHGVRLVIDGSDLWGTFPGATTAIQRAKHLIDSGKV